MLKVIRAIERFNVVMGVLSGLATLVITLIVASDLAMRTFFNAPIAGATETSTLLLIGLVYLGLASVQVAKENFRVEVFLALVPERVRRWQEFLVTLLATIAIGIFTWRAGSEALRSFTRGEMDYGAIDFPVWPARITIAVGLALLVLQLACDCSQLLVHARNEKDDAGEGALR